MALRSNAKLDLLARVPLFADCSKQDLKTISALAEETDFRDGKRFITEGEVGSEFFILVEGTAKVTRRGRRVGELGPGEWAGEMALLTDAPRSATVTATSPLVVLVITRGSFKRVLGEHPRIAQKLLATLAARLAQDARA
jgi:cAMP-dependent protein kinase regulator